VTISTDCIYWSVGLGFHPHLEMFKMAGATKIGSRGGISNQAEDRETASQYYECGKYY
jgi:hypothetical protein